MLPEQVSLLAITTIIGGHIVYSGISGVDHVRDITRGSVVGILITGLMRTLLFLAILGVVDGGAPLDAASPAASAFSQAAGQVAPLS